MRRKHLQVTYRFTEAGVYPYVCTYHVGMVGAVVVGDGAGGAIETTTADGPVIPVDRSDVGLEKVSAVTTRVADQGRPMWPLLVVALVLTVAGTIAVRRYRRRSLA